MKVLVLGGTGATGRLVVAGALRAGHDVTVLVRDPARLDSTDGLTVLRGDARSGADLASALAGQDAVLSALGGGNSTKSDIASASTSALVPAATKAGLKRVIQLSAFGVGESLQRASFAQRLVFSSVMKAIFGDKAIADEALRASGLDWTLVYPVTLTNEASPAQGAGRSTIKVGESLPMRGMPRVSRAHVADFMVAALTSSEWSRRTAVLST